MCFGRSISIFGTALLFPQDPGVLNPKTRGGSAGMPLKYLYKVCLVLKTAHIADLKNRQFRRGEEEDLAVFHPDLIEIVPERTALFLAEDAAEIVGRHSHVGGNLFQSDGAHIVLSDIEIGRAHV